MTYMVIVGNIGTVYEGDNYMQARTDFYSYVRDSKSGYGRASFEPVTWFIDDDIHKGFTPRMWSWEYTDTFGGEANYSWVHRGRVHADTLKKAVRACKKAAGLSGISCGITPMGDTIAYYPAGSCTVLFITEEGE